MICLRCWEPLKHCNWYELDLEICQACYTSLFNASIQCASPFSDANYDCDGSDSESCRAEQGSTFSLTPEWWENVSAATYFPCFPFDDSDESDEASSMGSEENLEDIPSLLERLPLCSIPEEKAFLDVGDDAVGRYSGSRFLQQQLP